MSPPKLTPINHPRSPRADQNAYTRAKQSQKEMELYLSLRKMLREGKRVPNNDDLDIVKSILVDIEYNEPNQANPF